jgi:hypothetical protein
MMMMVVTLMGSHRKVARWKACWILPRAISGIEDSCNLIHLSGYIRVSPDISGYTDIWVIVDLSFVEYKLLTYF